MAYYKKEDARKRTKEIFTGVWAAVPTPFHDDLSISEEGLRYNIQYCKKLGIKGVFTNGIIGEFWALTFEEKKEAVRITIDECKKQGIYTLVQTGATSADEVVELSNYADECGADFVCVIPPFFNVGRGDSSELYDKLAFEFFDYIQKRINIGFWIFDTTYTGRKLTDDFYEKLADAAVHFCGVKQGRGYDAFVSLRDRIGDRVKVTSPAEPLLLRYIKEQNLDVFMANPIPLQVQTPENPTMNRYAEAAWAGDFETAQKLWDSLEPARALIRKWHAIENYEGVVPLNYHKAWMELMGLAAGPVRPPLSNLTDEEKAAMKADLESIGLLKK